MKKFIRLQSEKYEINENSRSFEWDLLSIEYAMYDALQNMIEMARDPYDYSIAPHHKELSDELDEMELDWDNMDPEESKRLAELFDEWQPRSLILEGVSCYEFEEDEEEAAKELYEYFKLRNPEALENGHYVLIFEGEDTFLEGHNGENVAKWIRDIERVPTKEFFARYGIEI